MESVHAPPIPSSDLIDAPGIEERTGIHPEYDDTWPAGRDRFPSPVARLEIGKVWLWSDVEAWIGRGPG